jgi:hypothetical protein
MRNQEITGSHPGPDKKYKKWARVILLDEQESSVKKALDALMLLLYYLFPCFSVSLWLRVTRYFSPFLSLYASLSISLSICLYSSIRLSK